MVAKVLVEYGNHWSRVRRESGDGFERRPALLSEVVDIVHQEALTLCYFKGAACIDDAELGSSLERVA